MKSERYDIGSVLLGIHDGSRADSYLIPVYDPGERDTAALAEALARQARAIMNRGLFRKEWLFRKIGRQPDILNIVKGFEIFGNIFPMAVAEWSVLMEYYCDSKKNAPLERNLLAAAATGMWEFGSERYEAFEVLRLTALNNWCGYDVKKIIERQHQCRCQVALPPIEGTPPVGVGVPYYQRRYQELMGLGSHMSPYEAAKMVQAETGIWYEGRR